MSRIELDRAAFARVLDTVSAVAATRQTLPILAGVRLHVRDGQLEVLATSLDVWMRIRIPAAGGDLSPVVIPLTRLEAIVAKLASDRVTFTADKGDRAELIAGSARYRFATMDAREFPALEAGPKAAATVSLAAGVWREALTRVGVAAAAAKSGREILEGIAFTNINGGVEFAATDGIRLAVVHRAAATSGSIAPSTVLPRDGVRAMLKMLPADDDASVHLTLSATAAQITAEGAECTVRLLEGAYPDYQSILSTAENPKNAHSAALDGAALMSALQRALLFTDGRSKAVTFTIADGALVAATTSSEGDTACDPLAATLEGGDGTIAFAARLLFEALAATGGTGTVTLTFANAHEAGCFTLADDASYRLLMMPIAKPG